MRVRRSVLLLCVLLLGAALFAVAVTAGTPEPVLTLENDENVSYRVSAYTVEDLDAAGHLNVRVTTEDGDRKLVTYAELVWPTEYRNVTLVDDGVGRQSFVVGPHETTTGTVESWDRGDVTVYVVERRDTGAHTSSWTVSCGSRGQEHSMEFTGNGLGSRSALCAGGFDWIFR